MPTTRRQLAKGAAWSIPAVAIAASAPASAGSPTFDMKVEGSCLDLGGIGFMTPFWQIDALVGTIPAGQPFFLTHTEKILVTDIRDWDAGASVIGNVAIAPDGLSATFSYDIEVTPGDSRWIYLNNSDGVGVVTSLTYTGTDQLSVNNSSTITVIGDEVGLRSCVVS